MDQQILKPKVHCPAVPANLVRRPLLMERLEQGLISGRAITLVSAPAGYGKTTCVIDWVRNQDLPAAWLSLDGKDDDPGRFLSYLIAALQTIDPKIGLDIQAVISAGQMPPDDIASAAIINGIVNYGRRFILVLDDFHSIQHSRVLDFFNTLLANHPAPLHLVLVTREDPPLSLARFRANNKLTEVRARDLRFSRQDIEAFFKDVIGMELSGKDMAVLEAKTEGWIAGIQLAGLSLRSEEDPSLLISHLSGSQRFIFSYLTEQVLNHQPEQIQGFLLQTAILDQFNSDLCNALTKRTDAQEILMGLLNANLFLVPLDDEYQWFRYHHFFADLLRDLLQRDKSLNTAILHRRASHWYAAENMVNEAVSHALAGGDYSGAMKLLEDHALDLLMQGYAKKVDLWLQAVPEDLRSTSPKTNLSFAWMYLLRGAYAELVQYIGDWTSPAGEEEDPGLWAEKLALESLVLYMRGETDACMASATRALEILPAQDSRVLGLIYYAQAHVYLLKGDYPAAIRTFQLSIQHSRKAKILFIELMGIISLISAAFERGKLRQAYQAASQTISRLESGEEVAPISAYVYLGLGEIHYQWNQIEDGVKAARRALQLSSLGGLNTGLVACRILLSRLFHLEQKLSPAEIEILGAADLLPLDVPDYIRHEVAVQQVRVQLDLGQLDSAELVLQGQGVDSIDLSSSSAIFPDRANPYSIGRLYNCLLRVRLRQDQNAAGLKAGIELAGRIITESEQRNQFLVSLEALLLKAQFHEKLGDFDASTADLLNALDRSRPERLLGMFIDQGTPMAASLQRLLENNVLASIDREYAEEILAGFPRHQPEGGAFKALVDPLTDRELDVLLAMAEGLKYKEIAAKLFISLNTVRFHVKAIYGKLNVNNRTQAIKIARQSRIL